MVIEAGWVEGKLMGSPLISVPMPEKHAQAHNPPPFEMQACYSHCQSSLWIHIAGKLWNDNTHWLNITLGLDIGFIYNMTTKHKEVVAGNLVTTCSYSVHVNYLGLLMYVSTSLGFIKKGKERRVSPFIISNFTKWMTTWVDCDH